MIGPIFAKRFLRAFLCLVIPAAAALLPRVAKADSVQIGTVTVTSEFLGGSGSVRPMSRTTCRTRH